MRNRPAPDSAKAWIAQTRADIVAQEADPWMELSVSIKEMVNSIDELLRRIEALERKDVR